MNVSEFACRGARRPVLLLRLLPLVLLAAAGLGCDDGGDAAPEPARFDLRPRFPIGETIRFREEHETRFGRGPFPTESEVLTGTERIEQTSRRYAFEALELSGGLVSRARISFSRSLAGPEGALAPDPLHGLVFEVRNPFGRGLSAVVVQQESSRPATPAEATELLTIGLRLATSILPARPVAVGESWRPGRDPSPGSGRGPIKMVARLEAMDEETGRARVVCVISGGIAEGDVAGSQYRLTETVELDAGGGENLSYQSRRDWYPPRDTPPGATWHRSILLLTTEGR